MYMDILHAKVQMLNKIVNYKNYRTCVIIPQLLIIMKVLTVWMATKNSVEEKNEPNIDSAKQVQPWPGNAKIAHDWLQPNVLQSKALTPRDVIALLKRGNTRFYSGTVNISMIPFRYFFYLHTVETSYFHSKY